MPPVKDEHVLCSQTRELPAEWLPDAAAVPLPEDHIWTTLSTLPPRWIPRSVAEHDPAYKQWIPYILIQQENDLIAVYPRQGAETRLHGLWSAGVGGHINPDDAPAHNGRFPWRETFLKAIRRELQEEYPGLMAGRLHVLGLIHEHQTPVGRVHLGVAFLFRIAHVTGSAGTELKGLRWVHRRDIGGSDWPLDRFELWSGLAFQLLPTMLP